MPAITFSNGLSSGLDTQAIIDALLSIERQPAVLLQARVAQRTGQIAAIQGLSSLLVSLDIEADRLSRADLFGALAVTSSDDAVATAVAGSSAAPGRYAVTVESTALAQVLMSQGFASAGASIGTGSVSIQLGSGGTEMITIDAAGGTLEGLRDAINASDAEVTASIVNTGSGATPYRLLLTADRSGADNQILFTASLSGGTAPAFRTAVSPVAKGVGFQGTATFSNVGVALPGTYAGTATPTSGGAYTGASTRTYTFEAQSGGTVGTDAITWTWSDGAGGSGTVVVPQGYVAGAEIAVDSGITVAFSSGTITAGDDFTVAATGRGTYAGARDKTFTFTVATGGTVGTDAITIDWEDGVGGSGTIAVPASYTPGSQIAVAEGVVLAIDGGTLVAGDTFEIEATTPVLQAARDARIAIGDSSDGGNVLTISSNTNTFEDVIDGLTITVKSASATPVTFDVARDSETITQSIRNFIDRYNAVAGFVDDQLSFDPETGTRPTLLGDPTLLRVDAALRRVLGTAVRGADGAFRTLAGVGIRSTATGELSLDETKLAAALESDPDAVRALFARVGSTSDADVSLVALGSARPTATSADPTIAANGYSIVITRAAEQARIAGSAIADPAVTPLVIGPSNNVVRVRVNGVLGSQVALTQGTYTSGEEIAAELEARINEDPALGSHRVVVSWVSLGAGTGRLEVASANHGSAATIAIEDSAGTAWTSGLGFVASQIGEADKGVDVAGSINGEEAHGQGQILIGGPEDTETPEEFETLGLRLLVPLAAEDLAAQGGAQGTVTIGAGVGSLFSDLLGQLTDAGTGTLGGRERAANRQIEALNQQIDRINARVEKRRRLLEAQFARLEQVIAELQGQGSFLASQLTNLSSQSGSQTSRG